MGVAVVSMPALGGMIRFRMRRVMTVLLSELLDSDEGREESSDVALAETDAEAGDGGSAVRHSTHPILGWPMLVLGMVRANKPWTLVFGLSSALAAALATSAFGLSSTTIWSIGYMLPPSHRVIAAFLAVGVLVTWLILSHGLWEMPADRQKGYRRLSVLYNITTLTTLTIGVLMLYIGLFVLNLGVAWFVVPEQLLEDTLGTAPHLGMYLALAWGFSTMGVLAGAVGSSLESDDTVRQVAYGERQNYRLRNLEPDEERAQAEENVEGPPREELRG